VDLERRRTPYSDVRTATSTLRHLDTGLPHKSGGFAPPTSANMHMSRFHLRWYGSEYTIPAIALALRAARPALKTNFRSARFNKRYGK